MGADATGGQLDLVLLAVMADGPRHGYAVIEGLRQRSGGTFALAEGTVYPALHRLENAGLLSSSWSGGNGRNRKVYELTSTGAAELQRRATRWHVFAQAVNRTIGGPTWGLTS